MSPRAIASRTASTSRIQASCDVSEVNDVGAATDARRACHGRAARERLEALPHRRDPRVEPRLVAVDRPRRQPRRAGAPVPGERPVVEAEPEDREVLVHPGDGRQPLESPAEVVAEVADEARPRTAASRARRRGRRHPTDRRRAAPASTSPRRTGPRRPTGRRPPRSGRRSGSSSGRSGPAARSRAGRGPGRSRNASAASIGAIASSSGTRRTTQARGNAAVRGTGLRRVVHGAMIWGPSEGAAMKRGWRQRGRTGPRDSYWPPRGRPERRDHGRPWRARRAHDADRGRRAARRRPGPRPHRASR